MERPDDWRLHEENGYWYFWDETDADRYGPYPDRDTARDMMARYAKWLDGDDNSGFEPEVVL